MIESYDEMQELDHSADFEKIEKSAKYKKIKKALLDQLEKNSVAKEVFEDLVNDYMRMYIIKELLIINIKKVGVDITYRNRNGYATPKNNASVSDFNKVNLQMTKLLDKLKLDPVLEEDDEDEL